MQVVPWVVVPRVSVVVVVVVPKPNLLILTPVLSESLILAAVYPNNADLSNELSLFCGLTLRIARQTASRDLMRIIGSIAIRVQGLYGLQCIFIRPMLPIVRTVGIQILASSGFDMACLAACPVQLGPESGLLHPAEQAVVRWPCLDHRLQGQQDTE